MSKIKLCCPACIKFTPQKLIKKRGYLICPRKSCAHVYEYIPNTNIPVLLTKSGDTLKYLKRLNLKRIPKSGKVY